MMLNNFHPELRGKNTELTNGFTSRQVHGIVADNIVVVWEVVVMKKDERKDQVEQNPKEQQEESDFALDLDSLDKVTGGITNFGSKPSDGV